MSVVEDRGNSASTQRSSTLLASYRILRFVGFTVLRYVHYRWRFRSLDETQGLIAAEETACDWMNACMGLMGVDVEVKGTLPEAPVMLAPNHLGYMDILALGSVARTFFVSKDDVESWPLMGRIFKGSLQLSIARGNRRAIHEVNDRIADRMRLGHSVCVFLEGTTSAGDHVMSFHGSLLQSVLDSGMSVVPVAIRWSSIDGSIDIGENVAYWKDHVFGPHVFNLMGLRGLKVSIEFGESIPAAQYSDRKALATRLRDEVIAMRGDAS